MVDTQLEAGKVVLFDPTLEHLASAKRAERHNLEVESAASEDELNSKLKSADWGVLLFCNYNADTRAMVKSVRARKGLKKLPVFAIVNDDEIDTRMLQSANDHQIELLPTSVPEARRWQKLREAYDACRAGKRWFVRNRRAHFRLPLRVKATVLTETETVDISEGGIAFMTSLSYHVGDKGRIDVRSLLGDMQEDERCFSFEVTTIKTIKEGEFRYLVGSKFIGLSEEAKLCLKAALELIEPTEEDE